MVVETLKQSLASPVFRLALLVEENWSRPKPDSVVQDFLGVVKSVGGEEDVIKVRVGRLLAWAKTQDEQQAGYPGWTAFVAEHSPWGPSRTRDYIRLAECELDEIKGALSRFEIDLTVATRAPRELGPSASREAQLEWLLEAQLEALPKRHPAFMDVLSGDEMRRVREARELGAILIGWKAPVAAIDNFLIDCHERKLTGNQIVERARETPPVPERLDKKVPEWASDPAESLVGPWVEPTDLGDAIAKLHVMERLVEQRIVLLGMAYFLIRFYYLWTSVPGCNSLKELCSVHLGIAQRTFQEYARTGLHLIWHPFVKKEIDEGRLTLDRANFAMDRASSEAGVKSWIDLVRRLGRAELQQLEEWEGDPREEYGPAVEMAEAVDSMVRKAEETGTEPCAQGIGGPAASIAQHALEVGATGPIQVAVRHDNHQRPRSGEPDYILAPRELLAAADYMLREVELPRAYGTRRMVEHDRYTCQNPRCGRRTLRVHPHHIHQQQHGGTDEPSNLVTLCPACHLRGIHSNQMSVVRIGDWLAWSWPDGGLVIMRSPVSELVYERRLPQPKQEAPPQPML